MRTGWTHHLRRLGMGLGAALLLAGCGGTGLTENVRGLTGGAADPETPEFVVQSRAPGGTTYIPVGVTPPGRPTPVRTAGDVTRLEKELDAQRDRTKAFARRPTPRSSYDGSIPRAPKAPPPAPAQAD